MRFSITVTDLTEEEASRFLAAASGEVTTSATAPAPAKRTKAAPATLPAGGSAPAAAPAAPAAAPAAAPVAPAAPAPVAEAPAAPAAPAPVLPAGVTIASITDKARALATGPLKQSSLILALRTVDAGQLPKIDPNKLPAFDRLLDAAITYGNTPGATIDKMTEACQPSRVEEAIESLTAATNAAMGL